MTAQTPYDPRLVNRLAYNDVYGTALNRFHVGAAIRYPLTVYGKGAGSAVSFDILDTVRCVELAIVNPPARGEYQLASEHGGRPSRPQPPVDWRCSAPPVTASVVTLARRRPL